MGNLNQSAISRMEPHAHSCYSNLRMYDSINKIKDLVERAQEIGLAGICLTDHESLGGHVQADKIRTKLREQGSDFKLALGNEIYLVKEETADPSHKGKVGFYHFILIALDDIGHRMLRELSTTAWGNSYTTQGALRVPTYPHSIEILIKQYGQGHLYGSSACLASRLAYDSLQLDTFKKKNDEENIQRYNSDMMYFTQWCIDTFGEGNFSVEVAPAPVDKQIIYNSYMQRVSDYFNIPICIGTDAHYLSPSDRYAHQAFINARDDRAKTIYEYAYLQTEEEIRNNLQGVTATYEELCANSMKIYDKIQDYTLQHNQIVSQVAVPDFPKKEVEVPQAPVLSSLYNSDEIQERYWVNYCMDELDKRGLKTQDYIDELEVEADTMKTIGEKLDTCIFAYPTFLQKYINLIWDCGSTVGVGRGSSVSGLNHWLMGITQIDPVANKNLNIYWRFLNKERVELPENQYWAA